MEWKATGELKVIVKNDRKFGVLPIVGGVIFLRVGEKLDTGRYVGEFKGTITFDRENRPQFELTFFTATP